MTGNPAELILHNVSAMAIRDRRFAATGIDREVSRFASVQQWTEPSRNCGNTAPSDDQFQNVTSQLPAVPVSERGGAR